MKQNYLWMQLSNVCMNTVDLSTVSKEVNLLSIPVTACNLITLKNEKWDTY